jgi:hypothetical protein
MNAAKMISILTGALALGAGSAYANPASDDDGLDRAMRPASRAIEIAIGAGYAEGGGSVGTNRPDIEDVAGGGTALEVQIGYRVSPNLGIGLYGTIAEHEEGDLLDDTTSVFQATAGVQGTWHLRPTRTIDPWISLGSGWKTMWLDPDGEDDVYVLHGTDLVRLQLGVDVRLSPEVAITPAVTGSVGTYFLEDARMSDGYEEIEDREVSYSLFAGVLGRFDIGLAP